ncbi:MAG: prevent-host-death protein [Fibrobacteres bacterium]|nr:prevent-host-death protein [Fibrobacterota bacterium]
MSSVAKGYLKAHMLEYFRAIERTGETLIVTDHNQPVLKISPYRTTTKLADLFADIRDKVKINGDLTTPTTSEWGEVE